MPHVRATLYNLLHVGGQESCAILPYSSSTANRARVKSIRNIRIPGFSAYAMNLQNVKIVLGDVITPIHLLESIE
jgi:hypothetical protein